MRILFTHHFPLDTTAGGRWVRQWGSALTRAGHDCRCLVVDDTNRGSEPFPLVRVIGRPNDPAADLPFEIPRFSVEASAGQLTFAALSEPQLSDYRDQLRRKLDDQIEHFDPHLVHGQHVWITGQLALETGVPYLLSAWGPELAEYQQAPLCQSLADQAAENAARIFVPSEDVLRQLSSTFESAGERAVVFPVHEQSEPTNDDVAALLAIYRQILTDRFGQSPA